MEGEHPSNEKRIQEVEIPRRQIADLERSVRDHETSALALISKISSGWKIRKKKWVL
jgi:hypothetical protein